MNLLRNSVVMAALVAAIQIGFLGWSIMGRAAILREGREVLLKVEPVDPRDLLRGDYVRLGYEAGLVDRKLFANPPACHQVAEALGLPVLTVVLNNGLYNAVHKTTKMVYPQGYAARANDMPLTSLQPAPDYVMLARASRAHGERVVEPDALAPAIARALAVVRGERRQALLEVVVRPA